MASDKGWNDPPVLSYSTTSTVGPVRKTILNKRIAFPSTGSLVDGSNTVESASGGIRLLPAGQNEELPLPKPSAIIPHSPPVQLEETHNEKEGSPLLLETLVSEDLQNETMEVLKNYLTMCLPTLQKRTAEDISRRLDVLSSMWREGKLNADIHTRMYQCSQALLNGDYDQANNIHLALIVDHASHVTPWMVGLKHLIHESRNASLHLKNKDSSCEAVHGNQNDDIPETNSESLNT